MTLKCNTCGTDFSEFNELGVKCSDCYITFKSFIMPKLKSMHNGTKHRGKTPEQYQKKDRPTAPLKKQASRAKKMGGGGIAQFVSGE
jgi:protein-arginine kinase activator protein McsA